MPIKLTDVVHLEEIKHTPQVSLDGIKSAFGELTFALLTVIDSHNALEAKLKATEARLDGEIAIIKRALHLDGPNS